MYIYYYVLLHNIIIFCLSLLRRGRVRNEYYERYFLRDLKSESIKEIDPSDVEWDDYDQARQIDYGYFDLDDVEEAKKFGEEAIEHIKKKVSN